MAFEVIVFIVIAFITWLLWKTFSYPSGLPPGPIGIPLFGYMFFLGDKPHIVLNKLAQKYGDIFSLYLGNRLVVVLNSYETIKAAYVKQADIFHGKPAAEFLQHGEVAGIFQAEGELWKDYRRFSLSTLRDFGFGKQSMEPRIKIEIQCLLNTIQNYNEQPTDIGDLIRMSISNVICSLVIGRRYEYTDAEFQKLLKAVNELLKSSHGIINSSYLMSPILMKIPGVTKRLGHTVGLAQKKRQPLLEYMRNIIGERSKTHETGSEDNFIAAWLSEQAKRGAATGKNFTDEHLARMVVALFNAGSDTTANTIRWGLLYLMKHPEVQKCVQDEIDEVVGHERTPSMNDQERMPYTQATIMEMHRTASLVPIVPHSNIEETTLQDYHIPKRTIILPNLWAVHNNPEYFPQPEKFNPRRFLDANGVIKKEEKLIPFSMGKRQCLGESLARMELFLYFTSMMQRFTFSKPEDAVLSFDYDMGVVSMPKPYKVIATVRQQLI